MGEKLPDSVPVLGDDGKVVAFIPKSFANNAELDGIVRDEHDGCAQSSCEPNFDDEKPGTTKGP